MSAPAVPPASGRGAGGLLEGKIALVTGSTSNIGLATARAFAREGATVVVHSRSAGEAAAVASELGGDWVVGDVADPDSVAAMFAHIHERHGRLDAVVHGVAQTLRLTLAETSLEDWDRILRVNLTGAFLVLRGAAEHLADGGSITTITALSAERASPGGAAYAVSKGGLNALTRQAAVELADRGIRVNAIVSGLVGTPVGRRDMGSRAGEDPAIPLRRIGRPEEVAEAAVYLAGDRAAYVTGAFLPVDGGRSAAALKR